MVVVVSWCYKLLARQDAMTVVLLDGSFYYPHELKGLYIFHLICKIKNIFHNPTSATFSSANMLNCKWYKTF